MSATQDNRPAILSTPLGKDALLFSQLSGSERLSEPFHLELSLLSEEGELDGNQLLGQAVSLRVALDSGEERNFHGLVSDFTQLSYGERYHEYQITLRPWFWFLTRTADCRVFQDKTVPDIFRELARDLGFSDFRLQLSASYKPLAYCVQYRETAFNFLSRLLEQEGIYYFFQHAADRHTMVLVDDLGSHREIPGYAKVPYYPPSTPQSRRTRDHLTSWTYVKTVQPGAFRTTDFDFKKPQSSLESVRANQQAHALASLEVFDYPAELPARRDEDSAALDESEGDRIALTRLQELQSGHMIARGQGDALGLAPGALFSLEDYPREDLNKKYLVIAANYSISSNAYQTGGGGGGEQHIAVEAIDANTQFRPPRLTPKPVIQGAQTATVVGKSGEEIDTDEFGRVKIQFHWDRKGKSDDKSSCRVRVAQVWAGQEWGAIHIPRIGQEVIVSFLEGDPDRPIITGRVYNGDHKPPYELPAKATQSGIKSRSTKDGTPKTFNEIRFEDKKGSEELFIHAEKDFKIDVENDATWRVGLNEDQPAKSSKGVTKIEIGKTLHIDVGDEITIETGQSKLVMKKDGEVKLTCNKFIAEANQTIDLKTKGGKVAIDAGTDVGIQAKMNVGIEAKMNVDVQATLKMAVEGLQMEIKGKTMTKVEGLMLDLSGSAMTNLKGGLVKIN